MAIERQRYTDTLPVRLNEAEALERLDVAAQLLQERDSMEAAMKADANQRKADIASKEARMRAIAARGAARNSRRSSTRKARAWRRRR